MTGVPIGIVLSNLVYGNLYDQQAKNQGSSNGTCYGGECFQLAFFISSAIQFIPLALSVWLYLLRVKDAKAKGRVVPEQDELVSTP